MIEEFGWFSGVVYSCSEIKLKPRKTKQKFFKNKNKIFSWYLDGLCRPFFFSLSLCVSMKEIVNGHVICLQIPYNEVLSFRFCHVNFHCLLEINLSFWMDSKEISDGFPCMAN